MHTLSQIHRGIYAIFFFLQLRISHALFLQGRNMTECENINRYVEIHLRIEGLMMCEFKKNEKLSVHQRTQMSF